MANFKKPQHSPKANYDVNPKPPHGVLRMRLVQMTWRPVIIWGEERLKIDSANKAVLPLEGIESGPYKAGTAERLLHFFGRHPGTSRVVAKLNVNGQTKEWTHPMEVVVKGHFLFRVSLQSTHMALNAHDMATSDRYEMDETFLVPKDMTPDELFKAVKEKASKKRLKHLVFNCHGFAGQVEIFGKKSKAVLDGSNVEKFSRLEGLVDTIWITSCDAGYDFCKQVASRAKCHVVGAQTAYPISKIKLSKGQFDLHLGCRPIVASSGSAKAIEFGDFVMRDRRRNLEMEAVATRDPYSN